MKLNKHSSSLHKTKQPLTPFKQPAWTNVFWDWNSSYKQVCFVWVVTSPRWRLQCNIWKAVPYIFEVGWLLHFENMSITVFLKTWSVIIFCMFIDIATMVHNRTLYSYFQSNTNERTFSIVLYFIVLFIDLIR